MKLEWISLFRLIVGTYFLILFFFGLTGYLGKGLGFSQREAYRLKFGKTLGTLIHFGKVVFVPLLLGVILLLDPVLKLFRSM